MIQICCLANTQFWALAPLLEILPPFIASVGRETCGLETLGLRHTCSLQGQAPELQSPSLGG